MLEWVKARVGMGCGWDGVGAKRVNCSRTLVIPAAGNLPLSASRKTAQLRAREYKPNPTAPWPGTEAEPDTI
jgi:hypothetical protein